MKRYIMTTGLMCICVFCSLAQKQMMYGDTSRIGIPFSKDPHVVEFYSSKAEWKRGSARLGNRHCREQESERLASYWRNHTSNSL